MIRKPLAALARLNLSGPIIVLWGWPRLAVALLAGALSALAFAPFHLFPVLWLTVPVVVWLLDGAVAPEGAGPLRRLAPAAAIGWLFGFGFFVAGLWWLGAAFVTPGSGLIWLAPIAVLAVAACLAVFWAFGAALAHIFWSEGWRRTIVLALAMTVAEYLRGHLFTGLPWNAFGYALAPSPVMMQSAALMGLWGLTFFSFFIFAAPAALATSGPERRSGLVVVTCAAVALAAHVGYGAVRLAAATEARSPETRVRVVQPDIAQNQRWGIEQAGDVLGRLVALSAAGADDGGPRPDILIWPESTFPFFLTDNARALVTIAGMLGPGTSLITGAARAHRSTSGEAGPRAFNSIYVIDHSSEIRAAYDKVHLVPFGEYLPLGGILQALGLEQLIALPGGFSPGRRRTTLDLPNAPAFGPSICYEIIFPAAIVDARRRPGWLVNLTNDGWFGNTPGPHQHFHQARLRAVEQGLPLVRAANTGISAIVDGLGRITARLSFGRMGSLDGLLPAALPPTPYARVGDAIPAVVGILAVGVVVLGGRRVGIGPRGLN